MIRRSTWILLAVFVILLGAAIYIQQSDKSDAAAATDLTSLEQTKTVEMFFNIPPGVAVTGLRVEDAAGSIVEMHRRNESEAWALLVPESEADVEAIDRVVSKIEALRIETSLDSTLDLGVVGLEAPAYTLTLTLNNGGQQIAYIGNVTITGSSYYAQVDGASPKVVNKYNLDAAINLLTTPPILATPTPLPDSTEPAEQP